MVQIPVLHDSPFFLFSGVTNFTRLNSPFGGAGRMGGGGEGERERSSGEREGGKMGGGGGK